MVSVQDVGASYDYVLTLLRNSDMVNVVLANTYRILVMDGMSTNNL